MNKTLTYSIASILALFGILTLFLSSSVIFDFFNIRAREGNYVLFVVWSNFISSILYLFASYGFVSGNKRTTQLLGSSLIILLTAFIGLMVHIELGGLHETKTIGAMIFRISVTVLFTILSYYLITKKKL